MSYELFESDLKSSPCLRCTGTLKREIMIIVRKTTIYFRESVVGHNSVNTQGIIYEQ